ncbi:MAG: glycerol acyltransferase [Bacteroidales bacterium]|nr:glycerol acyltransferase [Bacteroidales bacterium]MCF8389048.1 glycerol acyltransferase [Bacteroidales bacterium]
MKPFSQYILNLLGWKITGDFPDIKKSITIFAPHTAHIDAIYGKLGFSGLGIKYVFLSKKELFFFPMNLIMKKFGSIAVRGVEGQNAIYHVVELLNSKDELHVVISPEGWVTKVTKWNKGFYYMATKANVPIVVSFLDHKKKEMGVKGVIYDTKDFKSVMTQINEMYKDVTGKRPERFSLDTTFEHEQA